MKIEPQDICVAPDNKNFIRVAGRVVYDTPSRSPETYWFDFPKEYAPQITKSGNPWVVCLLPLAMTVGEGLEIPLPVDKTLFENLQKLMLIWTIWYRDLKKIALSVTLSDEPQPPLPKKQLAFFSGGVDSYFTLLLHESTRPPAIDDVIYVGGYDIPITKPEALKAHADSVRKTAEHFHKNFIEVRTNLRSASWRKMEWGRLSHGTALATVALFLERRFENVFIASTGGYDDLVPWGTHILTDSLLSTRHTQFFHDRPEFNRVQKTEFIAQSDLALSNLHVCWIGGSETNCSRCQKCLRTMLTLDLLGFKDRAKSFNWDGYDYRFRKRCYPRDYDRYYLVEILKFAVKPHDIEIQRELSRCLKRAERLDPYNEMTQNLKKRLQDSRLFWRFSDVPQKILFGRYICK